MTPCSSDHQLQNNEAGDYSACWDYDFDADADGYDDVDEEVEP